VNEEPSAPKAWKRYLVGALLSLGDRPVRDRKVAGRIQSARPEGGGLL